MGLGLLLLSLLGDGLLGDVQHKVTAQPVNSFELMYRTNFCVFLLSLGLSVLSGQMSAFYQFAGEYPQSVTDLFYISLLGSLGQCFIYLTLSKQGPLVLSIVTTTRKFFTIILSIVYYGHTLNQMQLMSLALVFLGIGLELHENLSSKRRKTSQQKI